MRQLLSALICGCFLLITACSSLPASGPAKTLPGRDSLIQFMREHRAMTVVYGTANLDSGVYPQALAPWIGDRGFYSFTLLADTLATDSLLQQEPHLLIGTPESNLWMKKWAGSLPVAAVDEGFVFDGKTFDRPEQILTLSYLPSPANPEVPFSLATAGEDSTLLNWLNRPTEGLFSNPLFSRWGYQLFEGDKRLLLGMFDEAWQPGGTPHWDFTRDDPPQHEQTHFRIFQQGVAAGVVKGWINPYESAIADLPIWLGDSFPPLAPIELYMYPTGEKMGLSRNVQRAAYVAGKGAFLLAHPHYLQQQLYPHQLMFPFVRQLLGEGDLKVWETGLSVYHTPMWQREGWPYWAGQLAKAGSRLSLRELLDDDTFTEQTISPYVLGAFSGALVDFWDKKLGREDLVAQYQETGLDEKALEAMEPQWQAYLDSLAGKSAVRAWAQAPASYYRGMTLAHEGYSIYNGYGSDSARIATEKLQDLNVNSIAIVPYSGSRRTSSPGAFNIWQGAGSENDAAVTGSFIHAKTLGMQTLLKPQIYFPGAWPGEVKMENEEDWEQWFQYYRQWITHYAMLASLHEMDALCVGVEFVHTTQTHPEKWSELIRDLRKLYAGPITYAANWGIEAEKLAFGSELDFIGVNCYYPLSKKEAASQDDLREGFEKIKTRLKAISEQHNRPVVLTEVGFRCVTRAWYNPHAEREGRSFDTKAQDMGYEAVLEGVYEEDWCKGMFWWKWPTYMSYAERNPTSFTPCKRNAAHTLEDWYGRIEALNP